MASVGVIGSDWFQEGSISKYSPKTVDRCREYFRQAGFPIPGKMCILRLCENECQNEGVVDEIVVVRFVRDLRFILPYH